LNRKIVKRIEDLENRFSIHEEKQEDEFLLDFNSFTREEQDVLIEAEEVWNQAHKKAQAFLQSRPLKLCPEHEQLLLEARYERDPLEHVAWGLLTEDERETVKQMARILRRAREEA